MMIMVMIMGMMMMMIMVMIVMIVMVAVVVMMIPNTEAFWVLDTESFTKQPWSMGTSKIPIL